MSPFQGFNNSKPCFLQVRNFSARWPTPPFQRFETMLQAGSRFLHQVANAAFSRFLRFETLLYVGSKFARQVARQISPPDAQQLPMLSNLPKK
jgi:hypothetical protein